MVLLISLRSLCILGNYDLSIEIHLRSASGNAFEKLTGVAVRQVVVHIHRNLHPLFSSADIGSINVRLCPFSGQAYIQFHVTAHARVHKKHHILSLTGLYFYVADKLTV